LKIAGLAFCILHSAFCISKGSTPQRLFEILNWESCNPVRVCSG
jgi:hypothetical protein